MNSIRNSILRHNSGQLCDVSPCDSSLGNCGDGVCSETASGFECDCDIGSFGDSCENFLCGTKDCGQHGFEKVTYTSSESNYCKCECHKGYSGVFCDNPEESLWGKECETDLDCESDRQVCDTQLNQCLCDTTNGYILNQFQAELTYGQCVGPITSCSEDTDCNLGQVCTNNRCSCENEILELCLKNGEWECVKDPLPDCIEGILPSGKYGCCDQISGWTDSDFDLTFSYCVQPEEESCDNVDCGFYGTCVLSENGPTCECNEHWSGSTCSEFDHCNPNPCNNGGSCIVAGNHFECACSNDFTGFFCKTYHIGKKFVSQFKSLIKTV